MLEHGAARAVQRPLVIMAAVQVHHSESLLGASVERLSALERSAAKFRFTAEGPQPQASSSSRSGSAPVQERQQPPRLAARPAVQPAQRLAEQHQRQHQQQHQRQPEARATPQAPQPRPGAAQGRPLAANTQLPPNLQNFWFPAAFSSRLRPGQLLQLQLFEHPWVLFRDAQGGACCIQDTCAHRACPLSLGSVQQVRGRPPVCACSTRLRATAPSFLQGRLERSPSCLVLPLLLMLRSHSQPVTESCKAAEGAERALLGARCRPGAAPTGTPCD